MTTLLKLEELGAFLFSIWLFSWLPYPWWLFLLLLFSPDISMLGYLFGPAAGAATYNVAHHRAIALALIVAGMFWQVHLIALAGVILLAHASLDRTLGYGLKYRDAFSHTHMGWIGHQSATRGPNH